MKKTPLVSIITLTYNHEEYISKCIESVISQTYADWEEIIIDDGSSDRTREIIASFKDKRIRYYHLEHRGFDYIGENYNYALRLCRGEYIAILEGDDFWPKDKIEKCVKFFNDPEVIMVYGLTQEVTWDRKPTKKTIPG